MNFCNNMYVSPMLDKRIKKVKWKLRTGRPQPEVYVISIAKNNDLLEIYHSAMLKQKYYKRKENAPYIVGLACGYKSAVKLVMEMLEDVHAVTGGYDVKTYFGYYD